jgi:hypothetical protein
VIPEAAYDLVLKLAAELGHDEFASPGEDGPKGREG